MPAVHAKSFEHYWGALPSGIAATLAWLGEVTLNPKWRLELLPRGIHFRRHLRWSTIAWTQISAVESVPLWRGAEREAVVLTLTSDAPQTLGTFHGIFARTLRDRLRYEIASRTCAPRTIN